MRKAFVLFLSTLYLVLAVGFNQYSHMCKEMAVKLYSLTETASTADQPCPICASKEKGLKEKKKECCQYEAIVVKVDDGVKKQSNFDFSIKFWGDAIPNKMLGALFDDLLSSASAEKNPLYLSSKIPHRDNPLYILNCVYRI